MAKIHLTDRQWVFIRLQLPPPARTGRHRAGIGPTPALAQLTCLTAPAHDLLCSPPLLSPTDSPAFLTREPIERLLLPDGLTRETLARLRRCGMRTLRQLARLDERTLRRQFGALGAHLLPRGSSVPRRPPRRLPPRAYLLSGASPVSGCS